MKKNLVLQQGATFKYTFYWYSGPDTVVPITVVTRGYPTVLTAVAHDLPAGDTPVTIIGAKGATAINTESELREDRIYGTKLTADTLSIKVETQASPVYTGQGYLVYTPPVDLSAYTARLQIRRSVNAEDFLVELTDVDGLTLGADGSIEIVIEAEVLEALSFSAAVYDLELVSTIDEVTRLVEGKITFSKEVTRPPAE